MAITFYRIISILLVVLGIYHIVYAFVVDGGDMRILTWDIAEGVSTVLIGLLNFLYFYENSQSILPKYIILASNALFIGYLALAIAHHVHLYPSLIAMILVFISSALILNNRFDHVARF